MSRFAAVKRYINVEGVVKYSTEKAIQVSYEDDEGSRRLDWFPKSQIGNIDEIDFNNKSEEQVFEIADWLLKDKGVS